MANHFPVMPLMQLSALQYSITVAAVSGAAATFPAGTLDLVNRSFVTSAAADGTLTFDYSAFDQDTYETQLTSLLNQLATVIGGNLAVGADDVRAGITVNRKWLFSSPVQQLGQTYSTCELDDQMQYP